MAGTIGRVTAALTSVHNENAVSLANLNFDFTLVKLEAPKEFHGLGATISQRRKADAESGTLHKTARKLGALFEKVIPHTPALYRVYGTRVSEISKDPTVNPQKKEGIFASQIGADSASIWAAVTSGSSAIAVHLLGCMLARMFTDTEATSLWVELVSKRKEQIRTIRDEAIYSEEHFAVMSASQQEISRSELGKWDSSARAWLQSGDQAKIVQHKQLMLILNNLELPVNSDPEVYDSVMKAWVSALKAMDCLVQGRAQKVQDGAALLGMSSWHLYPDMAVLGGSVINVYQKDDLFEDTAILTVGLQMMGDSKDSISWSLPLACLQYYGHPVRAKRSVGQDNARITIDQFEGIILGCVFAKWGEYGAKLEDGLFWLRKLEALLLEYTKRTHVGQLSQSRTKILPWLANLCEIAARMSTIIAGDTVDSRLAKQLVDLGRRRSAFIFSAKEPPAPLFGLSKLSVILPILETEEKRIEMLREFSDRHKLDNEHYIIRYRPSKEHCSLSDQRFEYEFATVRSSAGGWSTKRHHDGEPITRTLQEAIHVRWLPISADQLVSIHPCRCKDYPAMTVDHHQLKSCPNRTKAFVCCEEDCTRSSVSGAEFSHLPHCTDFTHTPYGKRYLQIRSLGEYCLPVLYNSWDLCRVNYCSGSLDFQQAFQKLQSQAMDGMSDFLRRPIAKLLDGNDQVAAIFEIGRPSKSLIEEDTKCTKTSQVIEPQYIAKVFDPTVLNTQRLFAHFYRGVDKLPDRQALWAYAAVAEIYTYLPYATVSASILSAPLSQAFWIPKTCVWNEDSFNYCLPLASVFAVVAMFDSGTVNIEPSALSEVFAISSGNSIYVTSALLSDPSEKPNVADIRRIVGNIGQAGISFLIPPPEPKTRELEMDNWIQINHHTFDGKAENNFRHTTIHLSLTEYEMPLKIQRKDRHTIDRPARLVETILSVHDRGHWVADLNFLELLAHDPKLLNNPEEDISSEESQSQSIIAPSAIARLECHIECSHRTYEQTIQMLKLSPWSKYMLPLTSIDNWDELLDPPEEGILVLRAHENWLARLALAGVCWNERLLVIVLPPMPCWSCCRDLLLDSYVPYLNRLVASERPRIALLY
jgi:hypothetical protein